MSINVKGIEDWARRIRAGVGAQSITTRSRLVANTPLGQQWVDAIGQNAWFRDVLVAFVKENVIGENGLLYKQYHERSKGKMLEHFPLYRPKKERRRKVPIAYRQVAPEWLDAVEEQGGLQLQEQKRINMQDGFVRLWEAINITKTVVDSTGVTVSIGPHADINKLLLNDFMGTQGKTAVNNQYNSLFLAVEYGTGIEENVGAGNVVTSGRTKHEDASGNKDGSWWFRNAAQEDSGTGALYTGQKGFHFLYEARSREPRLIYEDMVRKALPRFISEALGGRSPSVVAQS